MTSLDTPTALAGARELAAICIAAAESGSAVLREKYDQPREIQLKGRIDLVTDADKASEERVLAVIRERAPGAAILAEESGAHAAAATARGGLRFIVDPLDGTTNYAHGLPMFCCTVAVELAGTVVAGCTVDPLRGETFYASRGGGAWLRKSGPGARPTSGGDRRLTVSPVADLSSALVCTGFPYDRRDRLPEMLMQFGRATEQCRGSRRLGSAAIDLAYVAAGRLDAFWELGLSPWDVAAGFVLVSEAGGLVTRFGGSAAAVDGREILACGPALAGPMRAMLAG